MHTAHAPRRTKRARCLLLCAPGCVFRLSGAAAFAGERLTVQGAATLERRACPGADGP